MIFRSSFTVIGIAAHLALPIQAIAQTPPATAPAAAPATKTVLADAEKEKDIRQLMALTGSDKMAQQMVDQMIPEMQKAIPQIPAEFWQGFRKKVKMSELMERLVPVYDKYYSKEDVKGLIAFYQTPLGQKMIATAPGISSDSRAIGSAWGQEIAKQVISDIQASQAAKPASSKVKSGKSAKPAASKPAKTVKTVSR